MGKCVACGEDVGKCVEVWGPNTLLIPHISLPLTSTSALTSPTPDHTFLHLLSYLFPHPSFLPPHPNTFSYNPHISLHLLKVWRSYHVAKLLATLEYTVTVEHTGILQSMVLCMPQCLTTCSLSSLSLPLTSNTSKFKQPFQLTGTYVFPRHTLKNILSQSHKQPLHSISAYLVPQAITQGLHGHTVPAALFLLRCEILEK